MGSEPAKRIATPRLCPAVQIETPGEPIARWWRWQAGSRRLSVVEPATTQATRRNNCTATRTATRPGPGAPSTEWRDTEPGSRGAPTAETHREIRPGTTRTNAPGPLHGRASARPHTQQSSRPRGSPTTTPLEPPPRTYRHVTVRTSIRWTSIATRDSSPDSSVANTDVRARWRRRLFHCRRRPKTSVRPLVRPVQGAPLGLPAARRHDRLPHRTEACRSQNLAHTRDDRPGNRPPRPVARGSTAHALGASAGLASSGDPQRG